MWHEADGGTVEFLQGVPLGPVLNGSGWAVAFWVTWWVSKLVYTGRLVPRSTYDDQVKALEIERKRNETLVEQNGRTADAMEVIESVVRALPQPPQQASARRGGGR